MNEYMDTHSSILRYLRLFVENENSFGRNLTLIDLDTASNPLELPQQDFVALSEFELDVDDGSITATAAIMLSTYDDLNLFRMKELTNRLLNKLLPGQGFPLVEASTGAPRGTLSVAGTTRVGAPGRVGTTPIRGIFVTVRSNRPVRP